MGKLRYYSSLKVRILRRRGKVNLSLIVKVITWEVRIDAPSTYLLNLVWQRVWKQTFFYCSIARAISVYLSSSEVTPYSHLS
jgi:hypothetical protein